MGKAKGSMSKFSRTITPEGIVVTAESSAKGWFSKLVRGSDALDLTKLSKTDERLIDAFAELRELGEAGGVEIKPDRISLSHDVLSRISDRSATALELPLAVELVLKMEMDGQLGSPSFSLRTQWLQGGQSVVTKRVGAILETERGTRRLPAPLLRAVLEAERVTDERMTLAVHWERLATFRNALEPEAADPSTLPDFAQQCSMNSFLEGLKLQACESLAIGAGSSDDDFEPLPFTARDPDSLSQEASEADALISGGQLAVFKKRFRERGATAAYRLADGEFLILTPGVMPLAELMAQKQQAPAEERRAFILNPEPYVRDAYRKSRKTAATNTYDEAEEVMGAADLEALDEAAVDDRLVVTIEYRDRVIGMGRFETPDLSAYGALPFTSSWMPERITALIELLSDASDQELVDFERKIDEALAGLDSESGPVTIDIGEHKLPAKDAKAVIDAELKKRRDEQDFADENTDDDDTDGDESTDTNILITETNFDEVDWHPATEPRVSKVGDTAVPVVKSTLMQHQATSLDWAQRAWAYGMPGVLNADEPGLGKTLQTLAFMAWLQAKMAEMPMEYRRPFLIIAPTSLLRNWEQEVEIHLHPSRFATVTRLYGSQLASMRQTDSGTDLQTGEAQLDLGWLETACAEGRGHNHLLLTTYRTAANYHHSLHRFPFSTIVFDEIQNLKNPATITAAACRSLPSDFRVGLTGTPIENKVQDLWAIMDQLSPGSFDSLKAFSERFGDGTRESLGLLNERLLEPFNSRPAIGIRRIKEHVVSNLPNKSRVLMPSLMPVHQAAIYDGARVKLASSHHGGALKALHHIRSVSAHPGLLGDKVSGDDFSSASARLQQVVASLDWIAARGERALVFVEARKLQYWLAEYLAVRYGFDQVDVINGNTSIPARQATVNRFQRHLKQDDGFDVLVLGPRAAGTGLTLTAANHVLHVSRWWNPAVEEQCNDRVHRIGQQRGVTIHLPLAIHPEDGTASFDCLLQKLMLRKRLLAADVLAPMGEAASDSTILQSELAAAQNNELPVFGSAESFLLWAEERLEAFSTVTTTNSVSEDKAEVHVRLHHAGRSPIESTNIAARRRVELFSEGPARVETKRLDDGTLVTELGGPLLTLWPEAVLEPSDQVKIIASS